MSRIGEGSSPIQNIPNVPSAGPVNSGQVAVSTPAEPAVQEEDLYTGRNSPAADNQSETISFPDMVKGGKPPLSEEEQQRQQQIDQLDAAHIDTGDYTPPAHDERIGSLDTSEQRLNALRRITQLDDLTATGGDADRCGAACMVAAALYSGGEDGLQTLADGIINYNNRNEPPLDLSALQQVREHLQQGSLTQGDISVLQDSLYHVLGGTDTSNADLGSGLHIRALETFLGSLPDNNSVSQVFAEGLNIKNISMPGGGAHFTLRFEHEGEPMVYDPWPRNGGQIVSAPEQVHLYQETAVGRDFRRPVLSE